MIPERENIWKELLWDVLDIGLKSRFRMFSERRIIIILSFFVPNAILVKLSHRVNGIIATVLSITAEIDHIIKASSGSDIGTVQMLR